MMYVYAGPSYGKRREHCSFSSFFVTRANITYLQETKEATSVRDNTYTWVYIYIYLYMYMYICDIICDIGTYNALRNSYLRFFNDTKYMDKL